VVEDEDLAGSPADRKGLVAERQLPDDRVDEPLRSARLLVHVVARPQAAKLFALERQLANQLGKPRVVEVRPGQGPQGRDRVAGHVLPVGVEVVGSGVEEYRTHHIGPADRVTVQGVGE
jgi:hypothetical protein